MSYLQQRNKRKGTLTGKRRGAKGLPDMDTGEKQVDAIEDERCQSPNRRGEERERDELVDSR